MTRRLYVFDTGLNGKGGHHGHFALHMPRSLARYDIDLRYFGHRKLTDEFPYVKVVPHFRHGHYRMYFPGMSDAPFKEITVIAKEFAADIASLGDDAPGDDDIVFMPTTGLREALGITEWMKASGRTPCVAMLFHRTFPWALVDTELGVGTVGKKLYGLVGRALAEAMVRDNCLVAATNRYLAELIARPLGRGVRVLPAPVWYGDIPSGDKQIAHAKDGRAVISILGHTRPEKGLDRIPAIIRKLCERDIQAHCLVQVNLGRTGKPVDLSACEALEKEGQAELIRGFVSDDEMNALIRRSTFVLMPYDRVAYRQMLSGMFAQVTAMGRPSIVPSNTWMADQIAKGRATGLAFRHDDPETIGDTVEAALAEKTEYVQRAEELAPAWRRERSGEALVAKLMDWAGVRPKI